MPRFRNTSDGTATIVGKLILLIATGKETSATAAMKLKVSPRQINRYVLQLIEAGWRIKRVGEWLKHDYFFELRTPRIIPAKPRPATRKASRSKGKRFAE